MPRKVIDYSKTKIYKIVCNDVTIKDSYVGSTTNFTNRKRHHKSACTKESNVGYNIKVYKFIRDNGCWANWSMILIEEYPCENELEKLKRERFWIEALQSTLNCVIPTRTDKEYRNDNKDKINSRMKEYYLNNKDSIIKRNTEYREVNKDAIKIRERQRYATNKDQIAERGKLYREANEDIVKESKKKYYEDNKDRVKKYRIENSDTIRQSVVLNRDKINNRASQRREISPSVDCPCGGHYRKYNQAQHMRSIKHLKFSEVN